MTNTLTMWVLARQCQSRPVLCNTIYHNICCYHSWFLLFLLHHAEGRTYRLQRRYSACNMQLLLYNLLTVSTCGYVAQSVGMKVENPSSIINFFFSTKIQFFSGRALRAALRHCLGRSDGRAQTPGVSESAAVAAGSDRLASAWGYHSCETDLVQESKSFNALKISARDKHLFFFHVISWWTFRWNRQEVVADQRRAQGIGLWVEIWHRNKTACSESNPGQNSRSKSTNCPKKGRLLRFESNSKATSDGGAQKLGNNVRRGSELIATKVCSQIGRKWNAMFESHVVTSLDRTSFGFLFEDFFLASCLCKQSSTVFNVCYWPTIHNSISS